MEVYADVVCPFTHVGLRRLVAERAARARDDVALVVRAWPLELVNGAPLDPAVVAEEVAALRASVAPDLFACFDPARFPATSVPALTLAAVAYESGSAGGERVSLAVRAALFEEGRDITDPGVLAEVGSAAGLDPDTCTPEALEAATVSVRAQWEEGVARGVIGSPHFFVGDEDMFCPTLRISHDEHGFAVELDREGFDAFVNRCFA
ncbi:MAG TPA: DsbA family protein [Acidimicrobiales bacterium]|nr:DsbA family protein [Acidimicrobiales bacterium]